MPEIRNYEDGTYLEVQMPWSTYVGGRAKCSDGKVRQLKRIAQTADTFFSVPASITVRGKTVAGFISVDDRKSVHFIAVKTGKNHNLLP